MTETLNRELLAYYNHLHHMRSVEQDTIIKDMIDEKIEAVTTLLNWTVPDQTVLLETLAGDKS